jgi:CBS domain-containing protein
MLQNSQYLVQHEVSIRDILLQMRDNHIRVVFAVNQSGVLIGSLTQGDIIRALIDGTSLKIPISDIANLNPVFATNEISKAELKSTMITHKMHAIPVVNSNKEVINVITIWDLIN